MSDPAQPLALCPKCAQEDKGAQPLRPVTWSVGSRGLRPLPPAQLWPHAPGWGWGRLRDEVSLVLLHLPLVPAASGLAQSKPW